jgi:hypothetical protein
MNDQTLVTVHGYAGDVTQVNMLMPYFKHHGCPVMILSPEDSKITPNLITDSAGVDFRYGGVRAYIHQPSLDRQLIHLKMMLADPRNFQWFLANDSDSVVLAAELPEYLYSEKATVWSNRVCDRIPNRARAADYPWPELAFQPPYFFSRYALEKLIEVAPSCPGDLVCPFIDWAMMAWTVRAGLTHRGFPEGASCGTPPNSDGLANMLRIVELEGKFFLHAIKDKQSFHEIVYARLRYMDKVANRGFPKGGLTSPAIPVTSS